MRVNDENAKRRVSIAAMFRTHDLLLQGFIKVQSFQQIFNQLIANGILRPAKHMLGGPSAAQSKLFAEVVRQTDPHNQGRIALNLFIAYLDRYVPLYSNKPCEYPLAYFSYIGSELMY